MDSATTSPASPTSFDYAHAVLPSCPTPGGSGWTDYPASGSTDAAGSGEATDWRFAVLGGGYRRLPSGTTQLVLRLRATNHTNSSQYHYPFYTLLSEQTSTLPTCFQVVSGNAELSPGGDTSEALAGFEVASVPTGALAVDVNAVGEQFRIDVQHP